MSEFWQDLRNVPLLRYCLLAGIISSFTFGVVGSFVVVRRIGYIASGIAHSILGGIGASFFLSRTYHWEWCTPMLGATVVALLSALVIGWVSIKAGEREDTIIGAIYAFGMAAGLLFLHFTPGQGVNLESFIFGNILLTSRSDVIATLALGLIVLVLIRLFYHQIVAVCFDEEFAQLRGLSANAYYFLLLAITAISTVLLVRVAGMILAIALIVLPAATASKFCRSLPGIMAISVALSILYNVGGLICSYKIGLPTGPFVVVLGATVYGLSFIFQKTK